jgi:hypothetical protein
MLAEVRVERRYLREELGLDPDDDDRLAFEPPGHQAEEVLVAVAWFPRDQHRPALAKWPDLADDLEDPAADTAALLAAGATFAWPPGRNDRCWWGSDRKSKRRCGPA